MPAGAQVRNEDRFFYTTLNGITLANTTVVANPLPSAPLESPAESPAALLIASELGFTGQWDTFSLDSGVVGIHTVLTSDNYVLLMERPGNREAPVSCQRGPQPNSPHCCNCTHCPRLCARELPASPCIPMQQDSARLDQSGVTADQACVRSPTLQLCTT